jgi:hypothetical protein
MTRVFTQHATCVWVRHAMTRRQRCDFALSTTQRRRHPPPSTSPTTVSGRGSTAKLRALSTAFFRAGMGRMNHRTMKHGEHFVRAPVHSRRPPSSDHADAHLIRLRRSRSRPDWSVHALLPIPDRAVAGAALTWGSLPGDQLSARTFARASAMPSAHPTAPPTSAGRTATGPLRRHGCGSVATLSGSATRCNGRRPRRPGPRACSPSHTAPFCPHRALQYDLVSHCCVAPHRGCVTPTRVPCVWGARARGHGAARTLQRRRAAREPHVAALAPLPRLVARDPLEASRG